MLTLKVQQQQAGSGDCPSGFSLLGVCSEEATPVPEGPGDVIWSSDQFAQEFIEQYSKYLACLEQQAMVTPDTEEYCRDRSGL